MEPLSHIMIKSQKGPDRIIQKEENHLLRSFRMTTIISRSSLSHHPQLLYVIVLLSSLCQCLGDITYPIIKKQRDYKDPIAISIQIQPIHWCRWIKLNQIKIMKQTRRFLWSPSYQYLEKQTGVSKLINSTLIQYPSHKYQYLCTQ